MEVFAKLLTTLRKHNIANFKSWLYAVVTNHCVTTVRKKGQRLGEMRNFEEAQKTSMENSGFERHYYNSSDDGLDNNNEHEAEESDLRKAIIQLKDSQKTCIRLFYFYERSYRFSTSRASLHWSNNQLTIINREAVLADGTSGAWPPGL